LARIRVIIAGAAGRDFHNFNTMFRNNLFYEVVCFTAEQIPNIEYRRYPRELAGLLYTKGIQVFPEKDMPELIRKFNADVVVLAYSDLMHEAVMHKASLAIANGADFWLLGPKNTMLKSRNKVIAVTAVRTGCGKSQTTREICRLLKETGRNVVVIRHPMPYGDLKIAVQHFRTVEDFKRYNGTIEEEEEYADHIESGVELFAGVDYQQILEQAEKSCDVIIWDGGNNDFSFCVSDYTIVVVDPLRAGHETRYHPGEANARLADVLVINKVNVAEPNMVERVIDSCKELNPKAKIFKVNSEATVDNPDLIRGKAVLVVEDGPSITHGELKEGVGATAARALNCRLIDPRAKAVGSIKKAYEKYPWIGSVLPALGYSAEQLRELQESINAVECDAVVLGTPADLRRRIKIAKPTVKVRFDGYDSGEPRFTSYLEEIFREIK